MATMTNGFEKFAGRVEASGVDVLGEVSWLSIADLRVSEKDVAALAAKRGLSDPPCAGCDIDAFRRATSAFQRRGEAEDRRYLMRPLGDQVDGNGAKVVERQVVLEVVERTITRKRLVHFPLAFVRYTDTNSVNGVNYGPLDVSDPRVSDADKAFAHGLARDAAAEYERSRGHLDGQMVRRWVMARLHRLATIAVHPRGGVYFTPKAHAEKVAAVRGFVRDLAAYAVNAGAEHAFHSLPVPDVAEQREMVAGGFDRAIRAEVAQVMADVAEMLEKKDVRPSSVELRRAEAATIRERVAAYKALLDVDVSEALASIEILDSQVAEMDARLGRKARYARASRMARLGRK